MANTLYSLAEQCNSILGDKVDLQTLIAAVGNAYADVVKKEWYENKASDVSEVDGIFLVAFKDVVPALDPSTDMYYIVNPSSYMRLPNEMGINYVGFAKGQTSGFVRISAGSIGQWAGLKANALAGLQTYFIEGTKTYFPKMTDTTNGNIMLRYAVALDLTDPEADLQIPPNVAGAIIEMVVGKYTSKPPIVPENLN